MDLLGRPGFELELVEVDVHRPAPERLAGDYLDVLVDVSVICDIQSEVGLVRVLGGLFVLALESESEVVNRPDLDDDVDGGALSCILLRRGAYFDHACDAIGDALQDLQLDLDECSLAHPQRHRALDLHALYRYRPQYGGFHSGDGDYRGVPSGVVAGVLDPERRSHGTTRGEGGLNLVGYLTRALGRYCHGVVVV